MRNLAKWGLFLFIIFFLATQAVFAQNLNAGDYIEKIEIKLVDEDSGGSSLIPNNFPEATTIYKTDIPQEAYLQNEDGTNYSKIGIHDKNVKLETTVYFNKERLTNLAGWDSYKTISIYKDCGGTTMGYQSIKNFPLDNTGFEKNFSVEFPSDPDCKVDLFLQQDELLISFEINNGETKKFTKTGYKFNIQDKPLSNTCDLQVKDKFGGQIIQSADNNTFLVIDGKKIDDGSKGYCLYLDGQKEKCYVESMPGEMPYNVTDGPEDFSYDLDYLDVGDHSLAVKQYESNILLCSMSLPIYKVGTTPTPFPEVTKPPDKDGYIDIDSTEIEIAETIPLCESIPEDPKHPEETMCGDQSCREKCKACEKEGKIWTGIGCLPTDVSGIVKSLFTLFSGLMGGLVFFCLVSNGLKIMTSSGNPEALKKAQEAITACLVGFAVLVLSVLFLRIVGVDILSLPGWS